MIRVAFYLRVSRDTQDDKRQEEEMLSVLEHDMKGRELVAIFREIKSGGVADRPEFQVMLKWARERKFDELWVWSLDRFSREGTMRTFEYLRRLDRYGVSFYSHSEPILNTSDSLTKEIILSVLAAVAKSERELISKRTISGLEHARKRGKVLGRPKGRKDSKPRRKLGYYQRWEK